MIDNLDLKCYVLYNMWLAIIFLILAVILSDKVKW